MHINKEDAPAVIDVPGALARQQTNFGDATGCGMMDGAYLSMAAGTDLAPLLAGLEGDMCQTPHWGYMIKGEVTMDYQDGKSESVKGGEMFYWPPGHTARTVQDAEVVLFSPQDSHCTVLDHIRQKIAGS
jgi:hypothetical protein